MELKADWKINDLKGGSRNYNCSNCDHKCKLSLDREEIKALKGKQPRCPASNSQKENVFFSGNADKALSET